MTESHHEDLKSPQVILQYIQITLLLCTIGWGIIIWIERADSANNSVADLKHNFDDLKISVHADMSTIQTQISGLPDERALIASIVHEQTQLETTVATLNAREATDAADIYKVKTDAAATSARVEDMFRASQEPLRKPR